MSYTLRRSFCCTIPVETMGKLSPKEVPTKVFDITFKRHFDVFLLSYFEATAAIIIDKEHVQFNDQNT